MSTAQAQRRRLQKQGIFIPEDVDIDLELGMIDRRRHRREEVARRHNTRACGTCGEVPQSGDPALSSGTCFFCGRLQLPPGPERTALRRRRQCMFGE